MSKVIQLRSVPDALLRGLKARAAMTGMSLSDYLLAEIKEIAETPCSSSMEETVEPDTSTWPKSGHFYFALTRACSALAPNPNCGPANDH
jgi:hypothetical protein